MENQQTLNNIKTRELLSMLRKIALPIALQSLIGSSLNLIDNLMVGSLGELQLNAVGVSVQIFFIGMVGEYVLSINQRVMHRPLVVEEERLNFEEK